MKLKQNQTWLFAFTDLAFLLLISLSTIPSAPTDITIHFSEMDIPAVPANPGLSIIDPTREIWELQVYQRSDNHPTPFRLLRVGVKKEDGAEFFSKDLEADELIPELALLKNRNIKPTLLPEKTSMSQDFLFAAGAIARVWMMPDSQAVVKPINPAESTK
ncbi:MAG: hypothetical protein DRH32_10520 [Deltaproteobacteria bacterium]|nr:MAG: hypothetical protein DRH32_10520 [Deltaproteobacteria bacterium]